MTKKTLNTRVGDLEKIPGSVLERVVGWMDAEKYGDTVCISGTDERISLAKWELLYPDGFLIEIKRERREIRDSE